MRPFAFLKRVFRMRYSGFHGRSGRVTLSDDVLECQETTFLHIG